MKIKISLLFDDVCIIYPNMVGYHNKPRKEKKRLKKETTKKISNDLLTWLNTLNNE